MFVVQQPDLVSWGVDYVRVTLQWPRAGREQIDANKCVLERAYARSTGGEVCVWEGAQRMGYAGESCGPLFWGLSPHNGGLWQVSGSASEEIIGLDLLWDNCSRIDLQATLVYEDVDYAASIPRLVANAVNEWAKTQRQKGKALSVRLIDSFGDGDTAYLGSRRSERFVRVYDKAKESPKTALPGSVRFELEAKGDVAVNIFATLVEAPDVVMETALLLSGELGRRGLDLTAVAGMERSERVTSANRPSTDDSRLEWLASQVAPTIEKLLAKGYTDTQLRAILGLV